MSGGAANLPGTVQYCTAGWVRQSHASGQGGPPKGARAARCIPASLASNVQSPSAKASLMTLTRDRDRLPSTRFIFFLGLNCNIEEALVVPVNISVWTKGRPCCRQGPPLCASTQAFPRGTPQPSRRGSNQYPVTLDHAHGWEIGITIHTPSVILCLGQLSYQTCISPSCLILSVSQSVLSILTLKLSFFCPRHPTRSPIETHARLPRTPFP